MKMLMCLNFMNKKITSSLWDLFYRPAIQGYHNIVPTALNMFDCLLINRNQFAALQCK